MTHELVYQRCTRAVQRAGIDKPGLVTRHTG